MTRLPSLRRTAINDLLPPGSANPDVFRLSVMLGLIGAACVAVSALIVVQTGLTILLLSWLAPSDERSIE